MNIHLKSINSTQTYLKHHVRDFNLFESVSANIQTEGYGRSGLWESNEGDIYCSIKLPINDINPLIAIVSMQMLVSQYTNSVSIKFPNDLYYNNQKLGGFIIEQASDFHLLGIGINVHKQSEEFAGLSTITGQQFDINGLISQLRSLVKLNSSKPLEELNNYYQTNCQMVGNTVTFINLKTAKQSTGVISNISYDGITIDDKSYHPMQIKLLNK